jgi:hypothetical protein
MSHKNKSAIYGYLHIEGVMVGVVDRLTVNLPVVETDAGERSGSGMREYIDRGGVRSAPTAFKTAYDIIMVVVGIRSAT